MTTSATTDLDVVRWSHPGFARIVRLAGDRAGLTFPENRREITEAAIKRAMAHAGVSDPERFAEQVSNDDSAFAAAVTELTIGETYFFRDPAQWDLVRREIAPELLRAHPDGRGVRVWSAGCASGEEAYTLGIVLRASGCISPTVIGTDLCEHRLGRATRAVYTKWSMRGLDDAGRRRYFHENGPTFHLLDEHRDARFRPLNLAGDRYGQPGQELSNLDLILCRNVLIYIAPAVVTAVFARLVASLRVGGWLMVAASDPQPDAELGLDVVVTGSGLLYRRPDLAARDAETPGRRWHDAPLPLPIVVSAAPVRLKVAATPLRATTPLTDREQATRAYGGAAYERAVALTETIIASGRDDPSTWVMLARAHANRGDLSFAAQACSRGIARYPDAPELHVVQSAIDAQRERFRAAAEGARRALYLDRTLAVAQLALGTALLRAGDEIAADRALRAAERMLAPLSPADIVPASDGASAFDLLSAVRAHRAILASRSTRVA